MALRAGNRQSWQVVIFRATGDNAGLADVDFDVSRLDGQTAKGKYMNQSKPQEQQGSVADEKPHIDFPKMGERWDDNRKSMQFTADLDNRRVVFTVPQEIFMDLFGGKLMWQTKEELVTACQEAFHEDIDTFHEVAREKIATGLAGDDHEITLTADDF